MATSGGEALPSALSEELCLTVFHDYDLLLLILRSLALADFGVASVDTKWRRPWAEKARRTLRQACKGVSDVDAHVLTVCPNDRLHMAVNEDFELSRASACGGVVVPLFGISNPGRAERQSLIALAMARGLQGQEVHYAAYKVPLVGPRNGKQVLRRISGEECIIASHGANDPCEDEYESGIEYGVFVSQQSYKCLAVAAGLVFAVSVERIESCFDGPRHHEYAGSVVAFDALTLEKRHEFGQVNEDSERGPDGACVVVGSELFVFWQSGDGQVHWSQRSKLGALQVFAFDGTLLRTYDGATGAIGNDVHLCYAADRLFLVEQTKAASYHPETGWGGCFQIVAMTLEGVRVQVYDLPGVTSVRAMCVYHDKLIVSVVRPARMAVGSSGDGPAGAPGVGSLEVLEGL